jgi:hypothetical protein
MHGANRTKSLRHAVRRSVPLPFDRMYYPYGFPVVVKSNHQAVMQAAGQSWAAVQQSFQETPIELLISVSEYTNRRCPSAPVWHIQHNLLIMLANSKNFAMCDLSEGFGSAWLTKAAVANSGYLRHHFVEGMAYALLESLHLLTLRAACVAKNGRGVLLFEESGAGKLSLAHACAGRGWMPVSDEVTCFARRQTERIMIGNPALLHLRPDAGTQPSGHQRRARAREGNPMQELLTESLPDPHLTQTSTVDYIVFVKHENARTGSAHLQPVSRDEARRRLHADVWSLELPIYEERLATVERLLQAYVCEMSYSDLDAAIDLLEQLLRRASPTNTSGPAFWM